MWKILGIVWLIVSAVIALGVGHKLMKEAKTNKQFYAGFGITMGSLIAIGCGMMIG